MIKTRLLRKKLNKGTTKIEVAKKKKFKQSYNKD